MLNLLPNQLYFVPLAHQGEQAHGGQNGLGEGQDDLEQDAELAGPVDPGGFPDAAVNAGEEGAEQDDVISPYNKGNEHDHGVVDQVQALHQQIGRNRAAADEHGQGQVDGHRLFQAEARYRKGISRQGGEQQRQNRIGNGVKNGVQVCTEDHVVLEHLLIGLQIKAPGPEEQAAPEGLLAAAE